MSRLRSLGHIADYSEVPGFIRILTHGPQPQIQLFPSRPNSIVVLETEPDRFKVLSCLPEQGSAAWLDAIEQQMAESAYAIQAARSSLVDALRDQLQSAPSGPFAVPLISLVDKAGPSEGDLASIWRKGRNRDAAAGRTLFGPHRADLDVKHKDSGQMAEQCSTGEQKALLLSLILAHAALVSAQRQAPPILLLDEVAAHLDPSRRAALFALLAETGAQVWMTGTEPELFNGIGPSAQLLPVGQS